MLIPVRLPLNPPLPVETEHKFYSKRCVFSCRDADSEAWWSDRTKNIIFYRPKFCWGLTDNLQNAEGEADGRIGEGHHGGEDWEPPNLVEIGDLREHDLGDAEQNHVRIAWHEARVLLPLLMKAIRPLNCPIINKELLKTYLKSFEQMCKHCYIISHTCKGIYAKKLQKCKFMTCAYIMLMEAAIV